jgi:hypothetical protein
MGLFSAVVVVLGLGQGLVQVLDRLVVAAQICVGAAEPPVGEGAGGGVGQVVGRVRRGLPHD